MPLHLGVGTERGLGDARWRTSKGCCYERVVQEHAALGLSRLPVVDLEATRMTTDSRTGRAPAFVESEPRPTRSLLPWSERPDLRPIVSRNVPQRLHDKEKDRLLVYSLALVLRDPGSSRDAASMTEMAGTWNCCLAYRVGGTSRASVE
jgi:hypothetical protein